MQPILLTPGPLTTSERTRRALLSDWGSWDSEFNRLTASVCGDLVAIAGGNGTHACVPLQGSGTFAVEAALGTFIPRNGKVLVPSNGAYADRIVRILQVLGREVCIIEHREDEPVDTSRVAAVLSSDPAITHVALVHCETGTGVLNPLNEVAQTVADHGRALVVDAMSSFAALPINVSTTPIDVLIASSGKCLEGVPGVGFVIASKVSLSAASGNSHSLSLDLHDQWGYMQRTGQWRYTPPTHVVAALRSAIDQFMEEGGQPARSARYRMQCSVLVSGMRQLGFKTLLADDIQSPIIVTFLAPQHPAYSFPEIYRRVRNSGFILYPGKLTKIETFRIGCIGAITVQDISRAVAAVGVTLDALGIKLGAT
jgi:2-aminoethylphosphonate-pyruvate transaminase